MNREKSSYAVQTVEKALDILEALTEESRHATLPYLAERLELSRNKAFRLLATLESKGLVERDDTTGIYRLGISSVELAQRLLNSTSLIRHAHPVMEKLARRHDEAVYIAVLKGEEVLFLDMVDCEQAIKTAPLVGKRFPFFTNAAGKAIKALESVDLLEKLLKKRGKNNGIPDPVRFQSELTNVRERGFAVDVDGLGDGIVSVAVAVRDYAGKVIGALTVLGPSFRMITSRLEGELIPSLKEGAETLSLKFGYAKL
ncbi:IclR family transcriptional regulator [Geobacter pickeringii]|uniref:IclR family transcriptional regulator n=1 Tax=Geobacter pickeringii TaxID=345632 RepID=A0A0B5BCN7_9BACT|nr:IclR family transcriptional regulator [Geobacter pickeringii]AJE02829.1 IclR family transcriptional regulator [Geobacter pickeringii]